MATWAEAAAGTESEGRHDAGVVQMVSLFILCSSSSFAIVVFDSQRGYEESAQDFTELDFTFLTSFFILNCTVRCYYVVYGPLLVTLGTSTCISRSSYDSARGVTIFFRIATSVIIRWS